jgi:hypothetical protein
VRVCDVEKEDEEEVDSVCVDKRGQKWATWATTTQSVPDLHFSRS